MFGWKKHFLYQIDYQYWANQQLFEALSRLTDAALAADAHILPLLAQMHTEVVRWGDYLGAPPAEVVVPNHDPACAAIGSRRRRPRVGACPRARAAS